MSEHVNPYMHACRVYLCLLVSRQHGIEREDKEGEVDHILQRVKVKSQTQTPYQCTHHHKMPHTNTLVWPVDPTSILEDGKLQGYVTMRSWV